MQRILLPALLLAALLAGGCTKDDATESAGAPVQPASNDPTAFEVQFAGGAFPPPMPADDDHEPSWRDSWLKETCMSCHEEGENDAPLIVHEGMPELQLKVKCRTCHTVN